LLERVRALGVETVFTTLHVGWDTFRPVKEEDASAHKMHTEYWELGREAAAAINRAKREGRRVISVGTTTVRLLEQAALRSPEGSELAAGACPVGACRGVGAYSCTPLHAPTPLLAEGSGWADLFIFPGFKFRIIDALVTNFHLPRSTLLMLVSAFAGRELILKAYHEAIEQRYRFYSFGDAMLVL
jgi:S-adenosylmethionine:tRNA ribosyltransferase-isomerase